MCTSFRLKFKWLSFLPIHVTVHCFEVDFESNLYLLFLMELQHSFPFVSVFIKMKELLITHVM